MTIKPDSVWDEMQDALAAARRGPDADGEAVHAFRSNAARLRAWLELAKLRVLDDDLRALRRCAGPVREADVALSHGGPVEFTTWLAAERVKRRRDFVAALSRPRFRALTTAFPLLPSARKADAADVLADAEVRVEVRAEDLAKDAPPAVFHRLRRALRRLRHLREWTGEDADALKDPLDALGELNDAAAAARLLERCPAAGALGLFREELHERSRKTRARALDAWSAASWRKN